MRRVILLAVLAPLVLGGCQADVERREMADDSYCRKAIAERHDARPNAYTECRGNMMQYHQQRAIAASGDMIIVNR